MPLRHSVLFDAATLAQRVAELADAVRQDLPEPDFVVVGLLTGSFVFVADLVRAAARLGLEPEIDFMAVSHYGAATHPSGDLVIHKDVVTDVRGRAVLLVDDILDSGYTLRWAHDRLIERNPQWLRICVLLDKPMRRAVPIEAHYVGFAVPDQWVVGYGLDLAGKGRGLPYIGIVDSTARKRH